MFWTAVNFNFIKIVLLLSGFALFYFLSIRETPIYDETEGQYAGAVRAMESYLEIPTNNGIPRLQKPPLTYWLMKLSASFIKNDEYAMRVPFIVMILGLLLTTYAIGVEIMDPFRALMATTVLGLSFGLFIFGRMVMPEIVFSFFIAMTFWASIKALLAVTYSARLRWWTLGWVMMACASFAKGFHGLFWPLTVLGIARAMSLFQPEAWSGFWRLRNLILFLVITLPWYVAVELKYPGYILDNLWNEQMGHALNFRFPLTYSQVSLFHYLLQHLFLLFPILLLTPHALQKWRKSQDRDDQKQTQKLLLIVPGVILVSTLFSARQDYYSMASWFSFSILAVVGLHSRDRSVWLAFPFWIFFGLGVSLFVLGSIWSGNINNALRSDSTDHLFSILFQLPTEMRSLFFISAITLLIGGMSGVYLVRKQKNSLILIAFIIAMLGPLWGTSKGVRILSDSFSLKKTALYISLIPHTAVIVDGVAPISSSLFYYLEEKIFFVRANPFAEYATRKYEIGREQYLDFDKFLVSWKSEQRLLLIIHAKDREFWRKVIGEMFFESEEGRSGSRLLIKNHL